MNNRELRQCVFLAQHAETVLNASAMLLCMQNLMKSWWTQFGAGSTLLDHWEEIQQTVRATKDELNVAHRLITARTGLLDVTEAEAEQIKLELAKVVRHE